MKYVFVAAAVFAATTAGAYLGHLPQDAVAATATAEEKPYAIIDAATLTKLIKDEKSLIIVDSRGGQWFDGTVIKGAKHLGADETNAESLAKVIPTKETPVVFYCADVHCPASEAAAHKAAELGYSKIYKYPGGIADWKEKGLATQKL